MAAASGLHLLRPDQYDPMSTTTYGTGELMLAAAEMGATKILLGLGGSATIDAGLGCTQACGGVPVLAGSVNHSPLTRPATGADISKLLWLAWDDRFKKYRVEVICASDVTNPLTGPNGAARVFGPQKGATPAQIEQLDTAMSKLAQRLRFDASIPGAGAAGGLGFALLAFFAARLFPGVEMVIEATRLRERLGGADLCFTGEGRLDEQTLSGKVVAGVARLCRSLDVPCIAIVGSRDGSVDRELGLSLCIQLVGHGITPQVAMRDAARLIAETVARMDLKSAFRPAHPQRRAGPSQT